MRIDDTIEDPNLSLVLPGGCNANCGFCFWKPTEGLKSPKYTERLCTVLNKLPNQFTQISITGGEPTMSPALGAALRTIARIQDETGRYQHVVLTTNGLHLDRWLDDPSFLQVVRHVNISRHHHDWRLNQQIFRSRMVGANVLKRLCRDLNQSGIDVTFNAVITPDLRPGEIEPYIEFARECGASAVCFRKRHTKRSTLAPTAHEKQFSDHKVTHHSACPVCRSDSMLIKGMPVHWKASTFEPSNDLGEIYELILQANGQLTSDWAGEHIVRLPSTRRLSRMTKQGRAPARASARRAEPPVQSCGSAGCGAVTVPVTNSCGRAFGGHC